MPAEDARAGAVTRGAKGMGSVTRGVKSAGAVTRGTEHGEEQPQRITRRFPRITRDTARPEGGGRAAGGDAPAPARQ
ncbi:hypothetical protein M878_16425, partial [Streptomyces roseochromogenus subsp. oscitans DS 12.976]